MIASRAAAAPRPIARIDREFLSRGSHGFGPVLLPDDATAFSLLFDATDETVGFLLDTYVSCDYGLTWTYAGGMGRLDPSHGPMRTLANWWQPWSYQTGIARSPLPPGTHRLFRSVLTLANPLVMTGILAVRDDGQFFATVGVEHHSVAFDVAASINVFTATSATTLAFVIANVANRAAMLGLGIESDASAGANGPHTVSGGAVGGVSGSLITGTDAQPNERTLLWGVTAPPSGSRTATISWTGTAGDTAFGCTVCNGVDQTTPFNNGTTQSASSTTNVSKAITSTSGDLTVTIARNGNAAVQGSNQTERWNDTGVMVATGSQTQVAAGTGWTSGDTGQGAGTTTHTWSITGSANWTMSGANFVQAATAPPPDPAQLQGASIGV